MPFAAGDLLSIMQSKMNGGLIGGRTYVIGGIPSASKTMLVNNLGDNICMNGHPVLVFSYDDGRSELRCRTHCRFSGFDIEDFNNHRVSKPDIQAICRNDSVSLINEYKYVVEHNIKIEKQSPEKIAKRIAQEVPGDIIILSPVVRQKKGTYEKLLADLHKEGYTRVRVDKNIQRTDEKVTLERYKKEAPKSSSQPVGK